MSSQVKVSSRISDDSGKGGPRKAGESHRKRTIRTYLCRVTAITGRFKPFRINEIARKPFSNVYSTGVGE
jgi:hypothetical protein